MVRGRRFPSNSPLLSLLGVPSTFPSDGPYFSPKTGLDPSLPLPSLIWLVNDLVNHPYQLAYPPLIMLHKFSLTTRFRGISHAPSSC